MVSVVVFVFPMGKKGLISPYFSLSLREAEGRTQGRDHGGVLQTGLASAASSACFLLQLRSPDLPTLHPA